jgi:hypothetical protein
VGAGEQLLRACGIAATLPDGQPDAGLIVAANTRAATDDFVAAIATHRHFARGNRPAARMRIELHHMAGGDLRTKATSRRRGRCRGRSLTWNARAGADKPPVALPVSGTALLLIDVINDLAFDGSDTSSRRRNRWPRRWRVSSVARPPPACRRSTSTITSGNGGRFPPHRRALHRAQLSRPSRVATPSADRARLLRAEAQTFGILRHDPGYAARDAAHQARHSHGHGGQYLCAVHANDAYMREYKIFAPADCIVSNTAADNDHALRQIKTVLKVILPSRHG